MTEMSRMSRGGQLFEKYWTNEGSKDATALAEVLIRLHEEARAFVRKIWEDGYMAATTQIADRRRRKDDVPDEGEAT
jgi:hypothetical protein